MLSTLTKLLTLAHWFGALAVLGGMLLAHITVWPRRATIKAYDKYTVRVPTDDGELPTVQVRVEVPAGLWVKTFQPKAGWIREVEQDADGRVVAVIWSGGSLPFGEFDEFSMIAHNPDEPMDLVWRAYQTDADGNTIAFDQPGTAHPAPITRIVMEPAP